MAKRVERKEKPFDVIKIKKKGDKGRGEDIQSLSEFGAFGQGGLQSLKVL